MWRASGSAGSPWGWASGWASPRRCWVIRPSWSWTSRSTGWTRRGCGGSGPCSRGSPPTSHGVGVLAPDGRDGADRGAAGGDRPRAADRRHHRRGVRGARRGQRGHRAHPAGGPAARAAARARHHRDQRAVRRAARGGPDRRADRRRRLAGPPARLRTDHPARLAGGGLHAAHRRLRRLPRLPCRRGGGSPMTAVLPPAAPAPALPGVPALRVTQGRVLRSEVTKLRSARSTRWTLPEAVVLMTGLGALFSAVTASQYHTFSAADRAAFNPVTTSLDGVIFAVVAVGVLGLLLTGGEYGTGMIRSSLTAVPRRLPVLWGKLAIFAGSIFAVSLVASFLSFFLGQALLSSHHLGVPVTAHDALRSVIGAALYVTVAGLIGVALGEQLRNTAAGITTFAAVFFVLPLLATLLPASISDRLAQYLPPNAGGALWGGAALVPNALSPWTGFALLCGYAAVVTGAGAWRLRRSDA